MHYDGNGIRQDYNDAFKLFKQIEDENIIAQTFLGIMYHKGQGVKQNYEKAEEYLIKSAKKHEYASNYLKLMQNEDRSIDTKVCPKCAETIKKLQLFVGIVAMSFVALSSRL